MRAPLLVPAGAALLLAAGCPPDEPDDAFRLVAEQLDSALMSVQGTAATDVWTVGADTGAGPAILHWDGAAWEAFDSGETGDLWWVHPTASRVTMVGAGGLILELDRATGEIARAPGPAGITLYGVWGAQEDDVWAVGGDPSGDLPPAIWHRDGGGWSALDDPLLQGFAAPDLFYKVHGASATDAWFVGTRGTILRWDGASLSQEPPPTTSNLFTVHTGGPMPVAVGGFNAAVILHYEGGSWVDRSPDFEPRVNGVTGRGSELVAVGAQGSIHRWTDGAWRAEPERLTPLDLHGVWLDPDGGAWTVGGALSSTALDQGLIGYSGPATVPSP